LFSEYFIVQLGPIPKFKLEGKWFGPFSLFFEKREKCLELPRMARTVIRKCLNLFW
jgi:hypothetical protein